MMDRLSILALLLNSVILFIHYQAIEAQSIQMHGARIPAFESDLVFEIGLHYESTYGIDTILGETDISDHPIAEYDVRVVQRDSLNFECLYADVEQTVRVYQSPTFESRVNLRPIDSDPEYRFFEIMVLNTGDWHSFVIHLDDYYWNLQKYLESVTLIYGGCNGIIEKFVIPDIDELNLTDFVLFPRHIFTDELLTNIIIKLRDNLPTSIKEDSGHSGIHVFPNPTHREINILSEGELKHYSISVIDIVGNVIFSGENHTSIDLSHYPAGIYFLLFFSPGGKFIQRSAIVRS